MKGRSQDIVRPAAEEVAYVDDNRPGDRCCRVINARVRVLDLEPADRVLMEQRHGLTQEVEEW